MRKEIANKDGVPVSPFSQRPTGPDGAGTGRDRAGLEKIAGVGDARLKIGARMLAVLAEAFRGEKR